MKAGKDEPITFFVDRCLGKNIVYILRNEGISVEAHDDNFANNALDIDWLPEVGKRGYIVLTKDARISKNRLERLAVANAKIKMFILASQNLTGEEMATILLQSITKMQQFTRTHSAPFIAKVYRDKKVKMWKDAPTLLAEAHNFKL